MAAVDSASSHQYPLSSRESDDVAAVATAHNDTLPDDIQSKARAHLTDSQKTLDILAAEIARARLLLDSLNVQHRNETARKDLYLAAIAPHRKVPEDLLSYIFTWCCSTKGVTIPWELERPPWTLGRVCSKWRRVALTTARLWNRVVVSYWDDDGDDDDDEDDEPKSSDTTSSIQLYADNPNSNTPYLAMKQEVLRRSGEAPLELTMRGTRTRHPGNPLSAFYADLHRIKDLCIEHSPRAAVSFLSLPAGSMPSLETFYLHMLFLSQKYRDLREIFVFQNAPKLQQVAIHCPQLPHAGFSCLPLHQLTRLNVPMVPIAPAVVLKIVTQCPSLITCRFFLEDAIETLSEDPHSPSPALVSVLESFQLNLISEDVDVTCLQSLVLPHLHTFKIRSNHTPSAPSAWDPRWVPTITSSGKLATLVLQNMQISPADLEELFKATPSLAVLEIISGDMISPAILSKMACGDLAPNLVSLECFIDPDGLGLDPHLDMLEQRQHEETPAAQITDIMFRMDGCNLSYGFDSERWKRLIERGCEISVYD